jgi:hypothetical protein
MFKFHCTEPRKEEKAVQGKRDTLTDQRAPVLELGLTKLTRTQVMKTSMIQRMGRRWLAVPKYLMLLIQPKLRCVSSALNQL